MIPISTQQKGQVLVNATTNGILSSQCMVPGKTYIGILPGHTRPAFVRKRPIDAGRPPWFLTQIFGSARRVYSVVGPDRPNMFSSRRRGEYHYDPYTDSYRRYGFAQQPGVFSGSNSTRAVNSVQQTCASCGRFRSPTWQARHPLIAGVPTSSSLCRRCRRKHSSSGDSPPRYHHNRRHHHRSHRYTDTTDDYYSSRGYLRPTRRHRSHSRDHVRRRSRSRDNIRVVIANQANPRVAPRRAYATSETSDPVRVVRHTEVIDVPGRLRSRSSLRSSSGISCIEDGARYVEDLIRPRHRTRSRSTSRVTFVEDVDDPVIISNRQRRRRVFYDGGADTGGSEEESRGRTRSPNRLPKMPEGHERGTNPTKEVLKPRSRASPNKTIEYGDGAELIEEDLIPRSRNSSHGGTKASSGSELIQKTITQARQHSRSVTFDVRGPDEKSQEDVYSAGNPDLDESDQSQSTKPTDYASDSEYHFGPYPATLPRRVSFASDGIGSPISLVRSYHETSNIGLHRGRSSVTPSIKSGSPSHEQEYGEPETPKRERRRRYRATDSDDGDSPQPSPITYRLVRAPSPPSPLTSPNEDMLADMFQSAHLTTPEGPPGGPSGAEYAARRPAVYRYDSYPSYESPFSQNNFYEGATAREPNFMAGYYGYAPDEELYDAQPGYDAELEPWVDQQTPQQREYDWMT